MTCRPLHMQLRWWHGYCRALAYEALGLFLAVLTAGSNQQTRQVQLLLESLMRSISQPFQQLPGVVAAFAAEAVFVLMSPGCAMYPPLNKLLLKRSELNIQVLPARPLLFARMHDAPVTSADTNC